DHAALIIEDYGDLMLENKVFDLWDGQSVAPIEELYCQCFDILFRFLKIAPSPKAVWCQRSFDYDRYLWELRFFQTKFLGDTMQVSLTAAEEAALSADIAQLSSFLAGYAKHFVHRDFHSRNVML